MTAATQEVFQAIADPTRREVLRLLADKERTISEMTTHFPVSRTAVVKHLQVLSEAQLISGEKRGREKVYRIHAEPLEEVSQWLSYFEQFWQNKLSLLQHIVEKDDEE
ncbi:ArsR/SmtB family transcription factor [Gracilibacillus salinarum]|uniref:Metalloregulator ArsR/SmtB family transcription factor n=1 Tax=Gracilibacillus salinarum TaxID=2932255 RepID=A0ABY4GJY7_9BACI|nr:metalloregulator ArsR/SmtB family transcription factor [Gracilibacillus salinarum]UOQ84567.1 metalloregulator ArsR/SmtB family transcription factor [Gracilibacillus salinarum]